MERHFQGDRHDMRRDSSSSNRPREPWRERSPSNRGRQDNGGSDGGRAPGSQGYQRGDAGSFHGQASRSSSGAYDQQSEGYAGGSYRGSEHGIGSSSRFGERRGEGGSYFGERSGGSSSSFGQRGGGGGPRFGNHRGGSDGPNFSNRGPGSSRGGFSDRGGDRGRRFDHGGGSDGNRGGRGGFRGSGRGNDGGRGAFSNLPIEDVCDQIVVPAVRSRTGTLGTSITVKSNHVACDLRGSWLMYMYHVEFDPLIESVGLKRGLVGRQRSIHHGFFIPESTLYSAIDFSDPDTQKLEVVEKVHPGKQGGEETRVKITFRRVKVIDSSDRESPMIFNNLLKLAQRFLNLTQVKRSFLDLNNTKSVPRHDLKLAPSYDIALGPRQGGLLLRVEVRDRPIRLDNALQQIKRMLEDCRRSGNMGKFQQTVEENLIGQVVMTTYKDRTYEVAGVDWNLRVGHPYKKGCNDTFLDYFAKKYPNEVEIRDREQPLLIAKVTNRSKRRDALAEKQGKGDSVNLHLVPELCRMTGLDAKMRENRNLMKDLADQMRKNPQMRVDDGRRFLSRFTGEPKIRDLIEGEWKLKMAEDLIDIQARNLGDPCLTINNRRLNINRSNFNDCLKRNKAERPVLLKDWAVVCPNQSRGDLERHLQLHTQIASDLGMHVENPRHMEILRDTRVMTYAEALDKLVAMKVKFILVVVPDDDAARYNAIKIKLLVENAIPNQVIKSFTMGKQQLAIVTKVAGQMLCKLGGALWSVHTSMTDTLVIGFDLWTEKKSNPVAAMVAALDPQMTKFFSVAYTQSTPETVSQNFTHGFNECVKEFVRDYKRPPKRVIVFRGGASYGELPKLQMSEVDPVRDKFKDMFGQELKLGFLVVNRRSSTMFYLEQKSDGYGNRPPGTVYVNPPAGTVIDTVVTDPVEPDFFLIPLTSGQGTVNPTYYRLIHDSVPDFSMDHYQFLAYKSSYGYFNWTGAIRVPSVMQFATKYSTLIGMHLKAPVHSSLRRQLSFL